MTKEQWVTRKLNGNGASWCKGLKASQNDRIKRLCDAGHKATKGKPSWNKGKPFSEESRAKMALAQKKRFTVSDVWNICKLCHLKVHTKHSKVA